MLLARFLGGKMRPFNEQSSAVWVTSIPRVSRVSRYDNMSYEYHDFAMLSFMRNGYDKCCKKFVWF